MNRNLSSLLLAVGLVAATYVPVTAKADEATAIAPFSTTTSLDLVTKYVWRGIPERTAGPSLQPSFTLALDGGEVGTFSANWWGNWDTRDKNGTSNARISEHDWTGTWAKKFDQLTITGGVIFYYLPGNAWRNETEVFSSVSYGGWWVVPTASVYYGFHYENGWYGNLNLSHTFDLKDTLDGLSAKLEVWQGAASANWERGEGVGKADMGIVAHDFGAKGTVSYAITKAFSVSLYCTETCLIDNTVRTAVQSAANMRANNLVGGLNLTYVY